MSGAAAGAAGGAAAAAAAEQQARRRRIEGEHMSVWIVDQDREETILAIGLRVKGAKLQAQQLGSGSWSTVGRFSSSEECKSAFDSLREAMKEKDRRVLEVPASS